MSLEIKGLDKLLKDLPKKAEALRDAVDVELTDGANKIEERAKLLAPVDQGQLKGGIFADTDVPLSKRVYVASKVKHAAYQEFGTGRKFDDQGYPDVAAQFKNLKGGSFKDMVKAIGEWLKRRGGFPAEIKTPKQKEGYARFVAIKILKNGIKPANEGTGYFFRAFREIEPTILKDVDAAIKKALNT